MMTLNTFCTQELANIRTNGLKVNDIVVTGDDKIANALEKIVDGLYQYDRCEKIEEIDKDTQAYCNQCPFKDRCAHMHTVCEEDIQNNSELREAIEDMGQCCYAEWLSINHEYVLMEERNDGFLNIPDGDICTSEYDYYLNAGF